MSDITQTIESLDLNIDKVFSDFYIVPDFQREYVWGEPQVEQLLRDIYDEFIESSASEYFIGSMVVCPGKDGTMDLIDGQQRMTTSYIILCVIRDYIAMMGKNVPDKLSSQIAATHMNDFGEEIFHYRVSLLYEDSRGVLEHIAQGGAEVETIPLDTTSIKNIVNAYQVAKGFIKTEFKEDIDALRRFYAYFINRVKLVRIKTQSISHALKVFETINDRGVGLDSMDLLKNLMFMQAQESQFEKLKNLWKILVDTLYKANEKPLRFLRYFIFATYSAERLREDEIYNWFIKNEKLCGYDKNPIQFVNQLVEAAKAYTHFVKGQNKDGTVNRYLKNLSYASGSARQHLILLLAGRHLAQDSFDELCRHIENLFFIYVITRENTRDFERLFALWAPEVSRIKTLQELEQFIDQRIRPTKANLIQRFEASFQVLSADDIPKYRMQYILGKLAQHVNLAAFGEAWENFDLFFNNKIEIEHILPQTPIAIVRDNFDQPEKIDFYISRLGNLTLLEKSINASIGNQLFEDKRDPYGKSQFLLTSSIARDVTVGSNTAINRAVQNLKQFDAWDSVAIDERQKILTVLAKEVWDMK